MSAPKGNDAQPRIAPGTAKEIGHLNAGLIALVSRKLGSRRSLNVFTTIARHPKLFRKWFRFAGALMLNGKLDRVDSELLILRTAHNGSSEYEWHQHERIALSIGLTAEEVERVRQGPDAAGWTPRQVVLLRAADELHSQTKISAPVWDELGSFLSDKQLIELCIVVGHYTMIAMTLNSLQVEVDVQA
jgi:alkylhydroperoxidase family enzyme